MQNGQKMMLEHTPLNLEEPGEAPPAPAFAPAGGGARVRAVLVGVSVYAVVATALLTKTYFGHASVQEVEQESKQEHLGGPFWVTPPEVRTGCTNWHALLLNGQNQVASTSADCGNLCTANPECMFFNFQRFECAGHMQNGPGACYLFKDGCQREVSNCWDLYTMRRSDPSTVDTCRASDFETMRGDDAPTTLPSGFTLEEDLGPLFGLLGQWSNAPADWTKDSPRPDIIGLNNVRLPFYNPLSPRDQKKPVIPAAPQTADAVQIVHEYVEQLEITPIFGAVQNRGYSNANHFDPPCQLDQFVMGISYVQLILNLSNGKTIHHESGQWLFNREPGVYNGWTVARMGVIPHGQAIQALGHNSTIVGSENIKADIRDTMDPSTGPFFTPFILNPDLSEVKIAIVEDAPDVTITPGYTTAPGTPCTCDAASVCATSCVGGGCEATECVGPYNPSIPRLNDTQSLIDQVPSGPAVGEVKATKLEISTSPARGGNIGQLPNPKSQAFTELFNFTFWIEEWTEGGKKMSQLQYLQTMMIDFMTSSSVGGFMPENCANNGVELDCLLKWPHYQMNTLKKINDYPFTSTLNDPRGDFADPNVERAWKTTVLPRTR